MRHGRFGWLPFAALSIGLMVAGRRVRRIILFGLLCLAVFVAGTGMWTDPGTYSAWSWLAILGFVGDLIVYPFALAADVRDKQAERVEADVQRAEYSILVQEEAGRRLSERAPTEQKLPEQRHVAPRFEYETDSGLIVRDHRAVDPDEL